MRSFVGWTLLPQRAVHQLSSPKYFYAVSRIISPWFALGFLVCATYGLISGLLFAPPDYQQGHGFRIIYVHVPAAFLSLIIYVVMASASAVGLIFRVKLAYMLAKSCAPLGASFTLIALVTGSIWGKPMWGTWWVWDARLTSELILLFLYLGYMSLGLSCEDSKKADSLSAWLAIIGVINIPIIHFSVNWWYTLHQGTTLSLTKPAIAPSMLWPLLAMIGAFFCYFMWVLLIRTRTEILTRERQCQWVKGLGIRD
ncbi:MAG: heme ABC transporter permease [Gammaproteobacteria bacterium]|nr:heme ABC transporter permease [Gammaproteobacteria bacterium]